MGARAIFPKHKINPHSIVLLEKHLLEKHFAFLKVALSRGVLMCRGYFQPSEFSPLYKYKIIYKPLAPPKVFVVEPKIEYSDDIHMYGDKSLCLYYPPDFRWGEAVHIYDTILPWVHEWFVFYELYLITGKWHHPFVEHKKI